MLGFRHTFAWYYLIHEAELIGLQFQKMSKSDGEMMINPLDLIITRTGHFWECP